MRPKIRDCQRACEKYFGITHEEICSDRREARLAHPRHVAMYFARKLSGHTLLVIGRSFGGRDHTTVHHAVRTAALRARTEPRYERSMRQIEALLIRPQIMAEADKMAREAWAEFTETES